MTAVDELIRSIEEASMATCQAFDASACMDATVPQWRFVVRGADAVRAELTKWYPFPGRMEAVHRSPLPGGELLEFCCSWEEPEGPISIHQAWVVEVAEDRITGARVWCGGRWTAGELADMAAAQERADAGH